MSKQVVRRERNAKATRHAILESALVAFTRYGYDGVGVREIAEGAGVTAMLVNRYFGSKEQLFEEVVEVVFSESTLSLKQPAKQKDLQAPGPNITSALLEMAIPQSEPVDAFLLILRSATSHQAARILRKAIARDFEKPVVAKLAGARATERSALILSIIAGVRLMGQIIKVSGLTKAETSALSEDLQSLFTVLLDSSCASRARTTSRPNSANRK